MIFIISPPEHRCLVGAAKARHRLHQRVENRLEIDGRTADDLEHVGGRGLLLKRLAQIVGARLNLIEQPHVLDGDDGLVGEGLQQRDLTISEWPHLEPINENYSQHLVRFEHGNREYGSKGFHLPRPVSVLGVGLGIEHVDGTLLEGGARSGAGPSGQDWILFDESSDFGGGVVSRHNTQVFTVETENE